MILKVRNTKRKCLIDSMDKIKVLKKTWTLASTGYLVSDEYFNGKRKQILLHRYILNLSRGDGKIVDHKNGIKTDNRRRNLRLVSHRQNSWNKRMKKSSTGYRGVKITSEGKRYRASINAGGKILYSKRFNSKIDAAKAYDRMAKKMHGKFASLNFK